VGKKGLDFLSKKFDAEMVKGRGGRGSLDSSMLPMSGAIRFVAWVSSDMRGRGKVRSP